MNDLRIMFLNFLSSVPTHILIMVVVILLMRFFETGLKSLARIIIFYAVIFVVLGFFGITMPSLWQMWYFIKTELLKGFI